MKATMQKTTSIILTLIMLFGITAVGGMFAPRALAAEGYVVGDIVEFGAYPQREVKDSATINVLNGLSLNWISYDYYIDDESHDSAYVSDFMKYADVTYNGNKYRAVKFTHYRPNKIGNNSSEYFSYQDDNGYSPNTVYWFLFEPIKWRVLDPVKGLVMAETCLDTQSFSNKIYYYDSLFWNDAAHTHYASDYATSAIRAWLNNDFYNTAFSSTEKAEIATTTLDNSSPWNYVYNSATTNDKVFLLSYYDIINPAYGFSSNDDDEDAARMAQSTDYAKVQGCFNNEYGSYAGNVHWFLRSPATDDTALHVCYDGDAYNDCYTVCCTYFGVRPALCLNLSSISIISSIRITGVTPPVIGAAASYDYEIPNDSGYRTRTVFWAETAGFPTNLDYFSHDAVIYHEADNLEFEEDKYYTFVVLVESESGYRFSSGVSATVNNISSRTGIGNGYIGVWRFFGEPAGVLAKTLSSISVTAQPTKTAYTAGESFDTAGMVVKANYTDGTSANITGYTVTNGTNLIAGQTRVIISYTEGGVTKTATVAVEVNYAIIPTVAIKNNPGTREINYGDEIEFTAVVTDMPEGAQIKWYVNGVEKGTGNTFNFSDAKADATITVKIVDGSGNALTEAGGNEISDTEAIKVKAGFFQKLISFFKNLFRVDRIIAQAVVGDGL